MHISILSLESANKIYLYSCGKDDQEVKKESFEKENIHELNFQLIIYHSDLDIDSELIDLKFEQKYCPCSSNEQANVTFDQLDNFQVNDFFQLFEKYHQRFNLTNNIKNIEEIHPFIQTLKDHWKNDRHLFFTELWYGLKSNLNCAELNIIFNDVLQREDGENQQKAKLTKSYISGKRAPEILPGGEREDYLMTEYEAEFESPINIEHFIPEKGELVCAALINHSPIIIMSSVYSFNQLQKAIIVAIFTGLQD
ncbi:hypothetical protein N9N67_03440 [Bacteriovoracaceae bacterium]|nr:hypothetical protein [Bacteriovoracaceae bacterium]